MQIRKRPFRLRVDGRVTGEFRTYKEAQEAAGFAWPTVVANYDISEKIGTCYFNRSFGYKTGTTSTHDLAAMGVPIHPSCLSDEK